MRTVFRNLYFRADGARRDGTEFTGYGNQFRYIAVEMTKREIMRRSPALALKFYK